MPRYLYHCDECDDNIAIMKPMLNSQRSEKCPKCGVVMWKDVSKVAITGTRDSFGIGKEFVDEKSGQIVDNWRTHEKLGYCDALEHHAHAPNKVKEGIKSKIERVKNKGAEKMKTTLA